MYKVLMIVATLFITGCSNLKVVELDPVTGYFPGKKQATVIKSVDIDLDQFKGLILVPNGNFTNNMVRNIGYFDEVINYFELETIVIKKGLTDQIPSVDSRIGIHKAAKAYKPFLWLVRRNVRRGTHGYTGADNIYPQLVLINPITLEELFVSETYIDQIWIGESDHSNYYPMMNSFIDYIKKNSKTY